MKIHFKEIASVRPVDSRLGDNPKGKSTVVIGGHSYTVVETVDEVLAL